MKKNWLIFAAVFLAMVFLLISCGGNILDSSLDREEKPLQSDHFTEETPDLEKLLEEFKMPLPFVENMVLKSETDRNFILPELIQQFAQALYLSESDDLIKDLNQKELMITKADFRFAKNDNESDDLYEEALQKAIEEDCPRILFYQLDLDGDQADEIIAIEDLKYDYSGSNVAYLLKKTGDTYTLAGYDYIGYYRYVSVFFYEGNYYLAANYDNYKTKTTKAVGLFLLNGDSHGFLWALNLPHVYLRKNGEDYHYDSLYENRGHRLIEKTKAYIQEIAVDLIYTDRKGQIFYGSEEEEINFGDSEDDRWTLDGYLRVQSWSQKIEDKLVDFSLFRKDSEDLFLLDARIREGQTTTILLDDIVYLENSIIISDYWDYDDCNLISVSYDDPDHDVAFCPDLWEQAEAFAKEVQADFTTVDYDGSLLPAPLILALEQALFDEKPHSPEIGFSCPEIETEAFYDRFYEEGERVRESMTASVYSYCLAEEDYYVLVMDTGGSARLVDIDILKETDGELTHLDNLLSLDLSAKVIEYEGAYYLLEDSYNYYSKHTDMVRIYRLTEKGIGPYVTICLTPSSYAWKMVYTDSEEWESKITDYAETIRENLMAESVIDDNILYFTGDEKPVSDKNKEARLRSVGKDYDYWEIDFNNDKTLEYVSKHFWFPSNSLTLNLEASTYQFTNQRTAEISNPFYGEPYGLLQLWFKEFQGKVFTFRLFFSLDHYVLNVSLIEGSHVSQVQTWMIAPSYQVTVEEGKDLFY